jgi:molybdate transport system substrate-binding protein
MAIGCASREHRESPPLLIFAAADLRDAMQDATRAYRAAGGDSVTLVFGSTGDLSTQIANGAPADLFFAANARVIDDLAAKHLIVDSTRRVYAIGRLAVVARCDTAAPSPARACPARTLADLSLPEIRVVAIADPAHAPYGMAARQALERAQLWSAVQPKLVLGANVAQADQFVTTGNADVGIVALALALRTPNRPYTLVDSALHDPLLQTVAVLSVSTRRAAAISLLRYLASEPGRAVMARYGFTAPVSVQQ